MRPNEWHTLPREGRAPARATLSQGRRIFFINRFFYPDHSATSQLLSDLCFALAQQGEDIVVITSGQFYESGNGGLSRRERVGDVQIHRVAATRFGRGSLAGRSLDYVSFHASAAATLFRLASAGDIVVPLTDPPLLSVTVAFVAKLRRLLQVNWLQDLYPEIAVQSAVPYLHRSVAWFLRAARNRSLRSAAMNVAIGELMATRIEGEKVPRDKIATITNWSSDSVIVPGRDSNNPFRSAWSLEDKFVIGHSGNLGIAHDTSTILGAAEILKHRRDICFLMIGGGSRLEQLKSEVEGRKLENFVFQPYQSRDALPDALTLPDVHWLSLREQFEGLLVPSKFYGIAAAGRPMILIGADYGELAHLIRHQRCGFVVAPDDCTSLADHIVALAENRSLRGEMGMNARRLIDHRHSMQSSIEKWKSVLFAQSNSSDHSGVLEPVAVAPPG